MKTLRTVLIATLVAFAAASVSAGNRMDILPKQLVHMSFEKAMQYPELVVEMHKQLNRDMLNANSVTFIGVVEYHNTICYISGTYAQWDWFFSGQWGISFDHKVKKPRIK